MKIFFACSLLFCWSCEAPKTEGTVPSNSVQRQMQGSPKTKAPKKPVFPKLEDSIKGYDISDIKETRYSFEITQEVDAEGIPIGPPITSFLRRLIMPEKKRIIEHEYALIREVSARENLTHFLYLGGQIFSMETPKVGLKGTLTFEGDPWEKWKKWRGDFSIPPNIPKISAEGDGDNTQLSFLMEDGSHKYYSVTSVELNEDNFHQKFEEETTRAFSEGAPE